jgi:hypothetical protein
MEEEILVFFLSFFELGIAHISVEMLHSSVFFFNFDVFSELRKETAQTRHPSPLRNF